MKLAVITGCDTGIGKGLARLFLENNYAVIISFIQQNPFENHRDLYACKLDLQKEKQIILFTEYVQKVLAKGHTLDFLINNAGVALGGPFEDLPLSIYRKNFEINFFGLLSLTQKLLDTLIESKGRLVINGSMAGKIAMPFLSPYASSKYALEGFADSIRRELNPYGIKTILLEPAAIATPIWKKAREQDCSFIKKKYKKSTDLFFRNFIDQGNYGMKTEDACKMIFKKIHAKKPKARYLIAKNMFMTRLKLSVPDFLVDRLVARGFKMDYGKEKKKNYDV